MNRCALVMSKTLGLKPGTGEFTLADASGLSQEVAKQKGKPEGAWMKDYYIQAEQLAKRLVREWGTPDIRVAGTTAKNLITGKVGVIFFQDAYLIWGGLGPREGDHLDLWSKKALATGMAAPFEKATKVWLWILEG